MNQPQETEQQTTSPSSDDPNSWLNIVKLLLERSVLAGHHIIAFNKGLLSTEQHSADDKLRFKMLPTEMIVAMFNLRRGIEEALLAFGAAGLPADQKEKVKDIFIGTEREEKSTDLDLLFQRVVEDGGPEGYLPVAKIRVPEESGVKTEEYLGSLELLKEMTSKYHFYDFENVPKAMEGACRKKGSIPDPFMNTAKPGESCSHLNNPQENSGDGVFNPEEAIKYQKMCEELIEDANLVYGQFCAVGSLYRSAIQG